jgi:hypothetical protein
MRFTSKGSKTVLIDFAFSSPMYMMGLYILPKRVHTNFYKDLSLFFWKAHNGRKKYHTVKWVDICDPIQLSEE